MSRQDPDFETLVGSDLPADERDRLRRAHDLLLQAGPPPELSPELERVPWPEEALAPLGLSRRSGRRRRPWPQIAMAAAALLLVGFLIGQGFNRTSSAFETASVIQMQGTKLAPKAVASVAVGRAAAEGNWPMLVTVTNLPPAREGYYDLWLSKGGRPVALCGTFNTKGIGETIVRMSSAYKLHPAGFDGWVVTRQIPGKPDSRTQIVLATPSA